MQLKRKYNTSLKKFTLNIRTATQSNSCDFEQISVEFNVK